MAAVARILKPPPERARWIDALPIPAALIRRHGGELVVEQANCGFEQLAIKWDCLDQQPQLASALDRILKDGGELRQLRVQSGDGFDARSFSVDMAAIDDAVLVSLVDTTAVARATQLLRRQMVDDPLTGLPNRVGFVELLEARMEVSPSSAVVAINLAQFSRVNDCIGPLGGDELLVTVARRLKSGMRDGDLLARTGGDEFALIVADAPDEDGLRRIGERIRATLEQPFRLSDFELKVDCAIGCAGVGQGEDAEQVIRHAQLALKLAKRTRRIECYRVSALDDARRRFLIETELRKALAADGLHVALQPLIDLTTNRIRGFEALARWRHWQLGLVAPAEFVAVAEDSGLIAALDCHMLDAALATLAEWDARNGRTLGVGVAINMSAIELGDDDLAARVGAALAEHGIEGRRLTVELTESAILADPDKASDVLGKIKQTGARIAMDDFGTGYSNLALLRRLPIDILKIDRSLVGDMTSDPDKAAIVRAILSLAHALDLRVTAEGIETAECARMLAMLGCSTGQGYHFAKPLDLDAAHAFALARGG